MKNVYLLFSLKKDVIFCLLKNPQNRVSHAFLKDFLCKCIKVKV